MGTATIAQGQKITDQLVTVGIGSDVFGVEVSAVREILEMQAVAALPYAPPFLLGMIDVRGQTVSIIDLRIKLGLPPRAADLHTRILVLDIAVAGRKLPLGLVVDRVFEVSDLDEQLIEPPPDIGVRWRSDYIKGVGRRRDNFVVVFDLARLLSADEVALVDRSRPAESA